MRKDGDNRYKLSRNNAKFTQEQAAEMLGVAPRTLSDYENERARVPDDVVAAMADVYNCPLLAWWHLKNHSVLGKFLPDVQMPVTNGDAAFQLWQAQNSLVPAVKDIMEIMSGELCEDKSNDLKKNMERIEQVRAALASVTLYVQKIIGAPKEAC
jgi:transcriptional regulator with XRE-family HTH domain